MHLREIRFDPQKYPETDRYPFCLDLVRNPVPILFETPVTLFVGENGTGKSTILKAVSLRCNIHMWGGMEPGRFEGNRYELQLHRAMDVQWADGPVPGSFFASRTFQHFARLLDEWATMDPGLLEYFGGRSLLSLSHGQSLMAFFRSRFRVKGLYLLDEPETALSPATQLKLVRLLGEVSAAGHAQFIIATHSPILLACPNAVLYDFDQTPLAHTTYEETSHYRVFKDFMAAPRRSVLPE